MIRTTLTRWVALTLLTVLLAAASGAHAQTDCSDPDNLCTGDPCVISSLDVASPCAVDFGARAVVVQGRLRLPGNGDLSFTADTIAVQGMIINTGPPSDALAAHVTLTAVQSIAVGGRISVRGEGPSSITLDAGQGIDVEGSIAARQTGAPDPPATIQLTAGGSINVRDTIRTSARTWNNIPEIPSTSLVLDAGGDINVMRTIRARVSGAVTLRADGNVALDKGVTARGNGPSTLVVEAGGNIDVRSRVAVSGDVTFDAEGTLTVDAPILAPNRTAAVVLRGDAGVTVADRVDASDSRAGTIEVTSALGTVHVQGRISTVSRLIPGSVTVTAAGDVTIDDVISASASFESAGDITLTSTGGTVAVNDDLMALATASGSLFGEVGGNIRVEGVTVEVSPDVELEVSGTGGGGTIRLRATGGDLTLPGALRAIGSEGPGGIIEGTASGDLTTTASFECRGMPDGCIALSAGGTLDTTGATFDKPLSVDCPGSPSGAFIDSAGTLLD